MEVEPIKYFSHENKQQEMKALPNLQMLSYQIENLRVVLRRMKANESSSLDLLINQKLQALK
ncbi:MAG: hypothetical protein WAS33_30950 [Candidatus Promineifilaceae bacterium]|nr:hypothetical protein [Anaerolineaceae bacterium]